MRKALTPVVRKLLKELAFARMVERGLADSRAKRTLSNVEVKRKIKSCWSLSGGPGAG